jgi:hypothetical protein
MSSARYPRIPDLRLPDVLKINNRQILIQAVEEGGDLALKQFNKMEKEGNPALKEISEDVVPPSEGGGEGMGAVEWAVILAKVGKFLLKYGKLIWQGLKSFAKTVRLARVNQEVQIMYDMNSYSVQQLNELTPQQIDQQIDIMTVDLLNANSQKGQEVEAIALTRYMQIYQQRKIMLPALDQRTVLLIGAGILAYLFFKK